MQLSIEGVLRKNRPLAGLYAGKRCFLLGSGPSVKTQNLLALKGEVKIALNWFQNHPDCVAIDPQFWVIADPNAQESHEHFLDPLIRFMLENPFRPKLFMPVNSLNFFATVPGAGFLDLHFFAYDRGRTLSEPLDFCKTVPEFGQNVVIPALMLALYLGCNPIYLTGCDHDWWSWSRDNWLDNNLGHFYAKPPPKSVSELHSYDDLQRTIRVQKYQYHQLKAYADRRGISIFNATNGGHLEIYPRADFNSLWHPDAQGGPVSSARPPGQDVEGPGAGYARAAIGLLNQGDAASALALADKAEEANQNRPVRIEGLDYLRAVCLSRLGRYPEALIPARTSMLRDPRINPECEVLIQDLEKRLASGT